MSLENNKRSRAFLISDLNSVMENIHNEALQYGTEGSDGYCTFKQGAISKLENLLKAIDFDNLVGE